MKLKIPQYQLSEVLNMMAFKGISEADIKTMMDLANTITDTTPLYSKPAK